MVEWEEIGLARMACGDCREILQELSPGEVETVITDPVWPNALNSLAGAEDPQGLFEEMCRQLVPLEIERLVVQIGFNSDPRFLGGVPAQFPFLRACSLKYVMPSRHGRYLNTGDLAFVFGQWPPSRVGRRVLPGEVTSFENKKQGVEHPCPRRLTHVRWLVKWWADGTVLDPFAGSGTTGVAAVQAGLPFVGIEIEKRWFDEACERIARAQDQELLWA